MATRLYFPEAQVGPVTPPAPVGSTEWEHIVSPLPIRYLMSDPDDSALSTVAYTPDSADDITNRDSCFRQYVSEPLKVQTFGGTVKGQFQCLEANAGNNLFITMKVLICNNAGSSTVGTLLAITRATSLELTTTLRNQTFPASTLSAVTCNLGDRLVVEVGMGGTPTATGGVQGHNGSLRWGCLASSGDLPIDESQTGTTFRPWIEFSATVLFFEDVAAAEVQGLMGASAMVGRMIR